MPVRVQPAPRYRGERPVDKGTEDAVFGGVGLLLVIMVPDLFDEGILEIVQLKNHNA